MELGRGLGMEEVKGREGGESVEQDMMYNSHTNSPQGRNYYTLQIYTNQKLHKRMQKYLLLLFLSNYLRMNQTHDSKDNCTIHFISSLKVTLRILFDQLCVPISGNLSNYFEDNMQYKNHC